MVRFESLRVHFGLWLVLALLLCGCAARRADPSWGPKARDAVPRRATAPRVDAVFPNLSLVIHEAVFSDLLRAVDTLRQTSHVLFKSAATEYSLVIPPPVVEIYEDGPHLRTHVTVKAWGGEYTTETVGRAQVLYDPKQDMLFMEMGELRVDIRTQVLGLNVNLQDVDISQFFAPRIKLLDRLPLATEFTVKKPKAGRTPVDVSITRHRIRYRPGEMVLDLMVAFHPTVKGVTAPDDH